MMKEMMFLESILGLIIYILESILVLIIYILTYKSTKKYILQPSYGEAVRIF